VSNAHHQLVVREALGNRPGVCLSIVGSHYNNPSQAITVFSSPHFRFSSRSLVPGGIMTKVSAYGVFTSTPIMRFASSN
jgi:hypothetical protein